MLDAQTYSGAILGQLSSDIRLAYWQAYEYILVSGDRDDPQSFDAHGTRSGGLGFWPIFGIVDDIPVFLPCWDRYLAMSVGDARVAPNADDIWRAVGRKMTEVVPNFQAGDWSLLCLPLVRGKPSDFIFQQRMSVFIPFNGSREVNLSALARGNSLEILMTWSD